MEYESLAKSVSSSFRDLSKTIGKQIKNTGNLSKAASNSVDAAGNLFKEYKSSTTDLRTFSGQLVSTMREMRGLQSRIAVEMKKWTDVLGNAKTDDARVAAQSRLTDLGQTLSNSQIAYQGARGTRHTISADLAGTEKADALREGMQAKYDSAITSMNKIFGVDVEQAIAKTKEWSGSLGSVGGRFTLIATAVVGLGKMYADVFSDMHKKTGLVSQAAEQTSRAFGATTAAMGHGFLLKLSDSTELVSELGQRMGTLAVPPEVLASAGKLVALYGVGADDAADLVAELRLVNKGNEAAVDSTLKYAKALAVTNNLPLKEVFDDLAKNSGELARNSNLTQKSFVDAVVQARQLGISMKDISGVMDTMVDFESSIQSEMQAKALTGANFDFTKLRQLSLNNDIGGATLELKKQLGGLDIGHMNRLQQGAISKAAGMPLEELMRMVGNTKLNPDLKAADMSKGEDKVSDKMMTLVPHLTWLTASIIALTAVMTKVAISQGFGGLGRVASKAVGLFKGGGAVAGEQLGLGLGEGAAVTGGAAMAGKGMLGKLGGKLFGTELASSFAANIPILGPLIAGVTAAGITAATGGGLGKSLFAGAGALGGSLIPGLATVGSIGGGVGGGMLYDKIFGDKPTTETPTSEVVSTPAPVSTYGIEMRLDRILLAVQSEKHIYLDGKKVNKELAAATPKMNM